MTVKHQKTVRTLLEAMPYIRRFWGATVVVKYGGSAMTSPGLQQQFAEDMVLLRLVGMKPLVVHGGGPAITKHLGRLGMESRFVDGHRVTDAATMEVARMVLVGKVNKEIVGLINRHGGAAIGLSGEDGRLLAAQPKEHHDAAGQEVDLGFVGDITGVNVDVLQLLAEQNIPVVASVAAGEDGQAYNVNADTVAGEIAAALGAEDFVFLTDVEGICEDLGADVAPISECDLAYLGALQVSGRIVGGMIPKVGAACAALSRRRRQRPRHRRPRGRHRSCSRCSPPRRRHQDRRLNEEVKAELYISSASDVSYAVPTLVGGEADGNLPSRDPGRLVPMNKRAPMGKTERQRLIQTVVQQREVATQRELVHALSALGCEVTQATVSRDIRELDLQKVRTHLGRAKYVLSSRERPEDPEQAAKHVLRDFARSTTCAPEHHRGALRDRHRLDHRAPDRQPEPHGRRRDTRR